MSYNNNLLFGLFVHKKFYHAVTQAFRNLFKFYEDEMLWALIFNDTSQSGASCCCYGKSQE